MIDKNLLIELLKEMEQCTKNMISVIEKSEEPTESENFNHFNNDEVYPECCPECGLVECECCPECGYALCECDLDEFYINNSTFTTNVWNAKKELWDTNDE